MRAHEFLANNALMMIAAFIIALVLGGFPEAYPRMNKDVAMASLMVMMSFSLCNLKLRGLAIAKHTYSIQRAFVLSFLLGTGSTILMAFLFSGEIQQGWIIVAAVPSAVSVVPFVLILGGELEPTLVSTAALYVIALGFTPFLTLVFLGQAVSVATLLWYVGLLIVVPLIVSRPIRTAGIDAGTRHVIINIAFAALVIAVAGSNRGVFFGEPLLLIGLIAVALVRTFGIGMALEAYNRKRGMVKEKRVPEVLFATHKNTGMAAALAIALLGDTAAVPATVLMTVDIAWLIYVTKFMYPRSGGDGTEAPSPA